jgi:putative two-component system response regulator
VAAMGTVVETRDPYTAGHERRVAQFAVAIANELGLGEAATETLRLAAATHDIGKIGVPAELLTKPGKLSAAEWAIIRSHSEVGAAILADIPFDAPIADIVRQHHERLDGSGYPEGLSSEEITVEARVLAVADVAEAMASHRPYRPAHALESVLAELRGGAGTRYDAAACAACERLLVSGRLSLKDEELRREGGGGRVAAR